MSFSPSQMGCYFALPLLNFLAISVHTNIDLPIPSQILIKFFHWNKKLGTNSYNNTSRCLSMLHERLWEKI